MEEIIREINIMKKDSSNTNKKEGNRK